MRKRLFIRDVLAKEGMKVTTNDGEEGILTYWKEPHKTGSTGRVYVDLLGRSTVSEFFPGVIGGVWKNDLDEIYDEIGKEFQDFDFTKENPPGKPPVGWMVKAKREEEIINLEIQIPEKDRELPLDKINKFRYVKKSQALTYYVFTRKKRR
jgi:hypothetical protein